MSRRFEFSGRLRSVRCALRGLGVMLASQHNAWLHAACTVAVVVAGLVWRLSALEWCALISAIVAVWVAEGLNTALELLADAAKPEFHPLIGKAKDVAAGAVLLTATGAVVIGVLVFGQRLLVAW
jgi:diacylglycerol kinase (ATP)